MRSCNTGEMFTYYDTQCLTATGGDPDEANTCFNVNCPNVGAPPTCLLWKWLNQTFCPGSSPAPLPAPAPSPLPSPLPLPAPVPAPTPSFNYCLLDCDGVTCSSCAPIDLTCGVCHSLLSGSFLVDCFTGLGKMYRPDHTCSGSWAAHEVNTCTYYPATVTTQTNTLEFFYGTCASNAPVPAPAPAPAPTPSCWCMSFYSSNIGCTANFNRNATTCCGDCNAVGAESFNLLCGSPVRPQRFGSNTVCSGAATAIGNLNTCLVGPTTSVMTTVGNCIPVLTK